MECNNLKNYLTQEDFACVGLVAKHCNLSKLCIAIEEAKNFDLIPLFCFDFVDDVLKNWKLESEAENFEKYQKLICGSTFADCNGVNQQNLGFKRIWVYYAYARYVLANHYNDSPNGLVQKQNEWSMPTPLREINDFSNKYRSMGKTAYEGLLGYLCLNKDLFTKFDPCGCKLSCGCSGSCSCGKTKKMSGFKYKSVNKNGF